LWDLAQGQSKYALAAHDGQILAVGFTPDGSCLASGGDDKKINLWDTASGGLIQTINEGVDNVVRTLAFSPDRGHLLAAGIYTTLFIWTRTD
jgi:WD40 repeat protein